MIRYIGLAGAPVLAGITHTHIESVYRERESSDWSAKGQHRKREVDLSDQDWKDIYTDVYRLLLGHSAHLII
jgi:hypothetical protein